MSLPDLCIRRPVFTTMLVMMPVVLGVMSYVRMGVDLFPNVDFPVVTITTARPGASVEEMETGVTKLIEEAVNTIAGIDELRSSTKEGISSVVVSFVLEKNRDVVQQEVQGKINTIIARLPTGTDAPVVDKFDLDAAPVMTIAVSGKRSLREVTEIADKQVKDALSSLNGVGSVGVLGGRKRAIQVTVDASRLEAYGLAIEDVRRALELQNVEIPGGRVDQHSRELVLRTMGRVKSAKDFAQVIVANLAGQPIRVGDVATVDDAVEEARSIGRLDGDNAVLLVVQKQSGTNAVAVIERVKKRLVDLEAQLAQGGKGDIHFEAIRDSSRFINASLHEVKIHLVLGAILVSLTIFLFLRDWRTMLIASLSIPVSLVATFLVMHSLGFTLNNITMLALVLAVGVVIDDAVVVHENIFRWMDDLGYEAREAARGATNEIALAVVATTLSLVVIFLPIAFMSGRVGRFFYSFGVTTAVAIMMSMLVSFTLTPMLCSRFLERPKRALGTGHDHGGNAVYRWLLEYPYLSILRLSLRHRWAVVLLAAATTASVVPLGKVIGKDFFPKDDQSEFEIAITTPEGWSLDRVDRTFREIEQALRAYPEVIHLLTVVGDSSGRSGKAQGDVTSGSIYVRLVDLVERKAPWTQFEIMARARGLMAKYPDLRTSVQIPAAVSGGGQANADVEFTMVGPDLSRLSAYTARMIDELRRNPGLVDVDTTTALRKPELRVVVDRDRASDLGVSIQSIGATLRLLVGGQIVSDFKDETLGESYDVWLRAKGVERDDRAAVAGLRVASSKAGRVELGAVARLDEARGPSQIDRLGRQRKVAIIANLAPATADKPAFTTDLAVKAFNEAFAGLAAPPEFQLVTSGRAKTQGESNAAFVVALVLSLVFMYMILAAQFESFIHPVTILLAVPLTIPFALLSLMLFQQSLNIYSILGVFLLFGIVKKNGILQVDYTNVLRDRAQADPSIVPASYRAPPNRRGWWRFLARRSPAVRERSWAIVEANRVRLRPILMTTAMLIASMIPIALGQGPGAGARASMAKVIVGGQAMSLLLSLLVTPVAYALFDDVARLLGRRNAVSSPSPAAIEVPEPDLSAASTA